MFVWGLAPGSSRGSELMYVLGGGNVTTYDISQSTAAAVAASAQTFSSGYGNAFGLAFDKKGNLYVSSDNNRVYKVDALGNGSTFASSGMHEPIGMAFDSTGNLYVANQLGDSITRYDSSGNLIGGVPFISGSGLSAPSDIAFDSAGNLYAANFYGYSVTRYDPSGNQIGSSPFVSFPVAQGAYGVTFGTNGDLYVGLYGTNPYINRYDSAGNQIGTHFVDQGQGLYKTQTIVFDSAGNLYAANDGNITKYNSAGVYQFGWSIGASPRSLAFKPSIVPEPSTCILGGIASGLMALIARRRKARNEGV